MPQFRLRPLAEADILESWDYIAPLTTQYLMQAVGCALREHVIEVHQRRYRA